MEPSFATVPFSNQHHSPSYHQNDRPIVPDYAFAAISTAGLSVMGIFMWGCH